MAKKNEPETMDVAIDKTEDFFARNSKIIVACLLALLVVAALIYGYKQLIVDPRADRAAEMISQAQLRLESESPDFRLALEGDDLSAGFLDVIERYGSTPSGNLAKHCAGICYLRLGELDQAASYLAKYKKVRGIPGAIVNAQNLGLQGDVAVEQGDYARAIKFYERAVRSSDNALTAPMYLRKAGFAARAAGDLKGSDAYFQQLIDRYPTSTEGRDAEKQIGENQTLIQN